MPNAVSFETVRRKIKYDELPQLREAYRGQNGSEAYRLCLVDWANVDSFQEDMVGDTYLVDSGAGVLSTISMPGYNPGTLLTERLIRRHLPEKHPAKPALTCVESELVEGCGFPIKYAGLASMDFATGDPTGPLGVDGLGDGKAKILLKYAYLPYAADVSDAAADADPEGELSRFVSRKEEIGIEAQQYGGSAFFWCFLAGDPANTQPQNARMIGTEGGTKTLSIPTLRYTLHDWPGIPNLLHRGNDGLGGKVNSHAFDIRSLFGQAIEPGRALLIGAQIGDPYPSITGTELRTIELVFSIRFPSWNHIFKGSLTGTANGPFREVTSNGQALAYPTDGIEGRYHPYRDGDMRQLVRLYRAA